MPIYDYACRNCGHRVEVLHGVNDAGPTACQRCGGAMRKLIASPAIVFKGSGWAKKDRAAAPAGKKEEAASKSDGADTKKPAATDESKGPPSTKAGGREGSSSAPATPSGTAAAD